MPDSSRIRLYEMRYNAAAAEEGEEEERQKGRGYHEKCNRGCLKMNRLTWLLKSEKGTKKSHSANTCILQGREN